jgi:hypothetical protein
VIIFDKFGDGQSERDRTVSVRPDNPMRVITLPALLGLTKEGTREGVPSQIGEKLSRPNLAAPSAVLVRDVITIPLRGPQVAGRRPRTLFSNRELDLLERGVSLCKQRKATVSNRELWTVENPAKIVNSSSSPTSEALSLPVIPDTSFRQLTSFLTGTTSHSEFVVTHSKQTTGEFLTGARIACFRSAALQLKPQECCSRVAPEQGKIPLHSHKEKEQL